jgi:hypothetical protein
MMNLVWDELQDASSRTSQPHIGSDGRRTKSIPLHSQEATPLFYGNRVETAGFGPI